MFKTAFVTFVCIFVHLFQVFGSHTLQPTNSHLSPLPFTWSHQCCYNCDQSGHLSSLCPHPVMCNICKGTNHKANACLLSWAREVPTTLPHDENCGPPTLPNDDNTENRTGDDMCDVSDEDDDDILHESPIDDEDVFLAELSSKPANDDVVSVANPGILSTNDDSLTKDVSTVDTADPQSVEDSPHLFSVDATQDKTVTPQPTIRSSDENL